MDACETSLYKILSSALDVQYQVWDDISMNFIEMLLSSTYFNSNFIMVCILSNYAHFNTLYLFHYGQVH